ncbi:MAG: adenine phosphoribosyltransferase [Candidatus Omnitrophica bacterium]|nr:adenine phosphoribosyltransferase [Candidatus Omnitrophota bacterium]
MVTTLKEDELKDKIRDIPDFPKEGIIFKDITTLLQDGEAFKKSIDMLAKKFRKESIDYVVGVEARGFIFGAPLAYKLGCGFVPVRKKGKLPHKTKSITYELEYGTDTLEMHEDALSKTSRVLVVDDLLATGGTIKAVIDLIKQQKADIAGVAFLVELKFLKGKDKLKDVEVYSVLKY